MRAGACASQHTLSPEAASVLKHSLSLARRRGHAQLTPLHVAATLLTSKSSLFRRACLKSQPHQLSHPLQSRALELCFNVALNRLPATPGGGLFHAPPSLSNALIAALKRAQAHQRRGCIEQQQQQQPLIAVKVELEQLILSILDDPSVSRVMREAGFSSTLVKNNLEVDSSSFSSVFQCYNTSGGIYSTPNSPPRYQTQRDYNVIKEDIKVVLEVLVGKKRRNTVIVGDHLFMAEGIVAELMVKVERGDVPEELKSAKLIKFQFSSVPLRFMTREEVDMNVADLKRKVESFSSVGKVIIYIGDLKWAVDRDDNSYSPVDHLISEIGKLVCWYNSLNYMKVWLIASADYQTYMKCQMKQPPLDVQWALQAVSVPSGGLGLSLNAATSVPDSRITFPQNPCQVTDKKLLCLKEEHDVLTCCPECLSNYEKEAAFNSLNSIIKNKENGSASLPFWLKPHANQTLDKEDLVQLRRKYNKLCQSLHQGSQIGRNYYNTSSYLNCPNKNNIVSDYETISFASPNQTVPRFRRQQSCHIEFSFNNGSSKSRSTEPNLDSLKSMDSKEVKITLALGNSVYEKCAVDSDIFQENVPWQSETIPLILEAVMDDDAMISTNKDKFLLIQGNDAVGKRRLAVGLAKSLFGSSELLFCMNMRNNANYTLSENCEMLEKALRNHEKLVVLVENVDCADPEFVKFLLKGRKMETTTDSGRVIFILTMEGDEKLDNNTKGENINSVIQMKLLVQESKLGTDILNLEHKRKADWDLSTRRGKNLRSDEMDEVSSNILDLNIKASDDDDDGVKELKSGELTPISGDLFCETTIERHSLLSFLKNIKDRFVLNRSSGKDRQAREMFLSKFQRSFEETSGRKNMSSFNVEDKVLEEVLRGSGSYLNNLFEQWLKDIFETSLRMVVDKREGEKVSIRLCLGGKGENCVKDGFMGTCLPKRIQVAFLG